MSSNLTDGIESSLRIRSTINNNKDQEKKNQHREDFLFNRNTYGNKQPPQIVTSHFKMRDLYNREKRLEYWIERVKTDLDENDRNDVLKFVEIMQDKDQANLTIIRNITAILQMRKQLEKPYSEVTKDDIKLLFKWMDDKGYKVATHVKFRAVLKKFYKMVYGNCENYPDSVKWFSVNLSKDKRIQERQLDINEYLEEEEVKKLIEATPTLQKKAFLACLYESGARPEEFLRLTNLDLKIDTKGALLILRGKTGERRIRIISFASLLEQWLDVHPLKDQKEFSIWITEATNYKNKPLGIKGAGEIIKEALPKSNLSNKHSRLYLLRHSRATHLATWLSESQLCVFFGWQHGTTVVRQYIHLSGKDLDNTLLSISEGRPMRREEEFQLKITKCNRCSESLSPTQQFCGRCALPVSITDQYLRENEIEKENVLLKNQINMVREEMNEKFDKIFTLIQQNPKIAYIKLDVLNKLL